MENIIDKSSQIPFYYQIKEQIKKEIESGRLPVNSKIPTESELMKQYGVSRVTVRLATQELVRSGCVEKKRGKGTYVIPIKATQDLGVITSWAETMKKSGGVLRSRLLCAIEQNADISTAERMEISPGEKIYYIERLRYVDDQPVCVMINYILASAAPGIDQKIQATDSLYDLLEGYYGIVIDSAVEKVEANAANRKEADLLKIHGGTPILHVTRITKEKGGRVFEIVEASSRADRYSYRMILSGRPYKG
jgi:GntR family transcriptional regulator